MKGILGYIEAFTAFQIYIRISLNLRMREPSAAFLAGSNKQALKHHGSSRKAAADAETPCSTVWRILKKLEQPQVSNQRSIGPLSALDNEAAYDLLSEHTVDSAAVKALQ